ncbi:hypothetical protein SAMN05428975_0046 [Mucilaginibacter sp. OK268]|jgi:hypothetical protein|nr:hypothetical protein SAMN05428975_0046 [Mucilaginibacter sp. OK268]
MPGLFVALNSKHTSLRGTKQSPTYRVVLYSLEIASYLAMTRAYVLYLDS